MRRMLWSLAVLPYTKAMKSSMKASTYAFSRFQPCGNNEEMNNTDSFNKLKDLLSMKRAVRNESQYEYNHRLWLAKTIVEMKKAEGLEIIRAYQKEQQVLEECQELIKKGRELKNFLDRWKILRFQIKLPWIGYVHVLIGMELLSHN